MSTDMHEPTTRTDWRHTPLSRMPKHGPESGATPEISRLIPNPQNSYQALLQVSWEIDLWGRIRRLSESARANLLATDEARRGVVLSLVSQVAGNYLTLRGLDAQLVIAKQTLGTYAESVGPPLTLWPSSGQGDGTRRRRPPPAPSPAPAHRWRRRSASRRCRCP